MAKFIIQGGKPLGGEIEISGAKNSATKALAAAFLFEGPIQIKNVPQVEDVFRMSELVSASGAEISNLGERTLTLSAPQEAKTDLEENIAKRLRASVVLLGPMLARYGRVSIPHPGGCVIGKRPIDFFIDGLKAMGASVKESGKRFFFETKGLKSADFSFPISSVTATETLMMAAVLADGKVVLRNCALEPEIEALANFLNDSGAKIQGAGTHTIAIKGLGRAKRLKARASFELIPDRIDAGSMLILGALLADPTKGGLKIKNCVPSHLSSVISHLKKAGVKIKSGTDWLWVLRPKKLKPVDAKTSEYPGFATDLQAPFTVFLTQAEGKSEVFETIFEGRLEYVSELVRMGANITPCDPHRVIVFGPTPLFGKELESPDLRAGLAFVLAGLIAKGETVVHNVYNIDRGYEAVEKKLSSIGADIKRI